MFRSQRNIYFVLCLSVLTLSCVNSQIYPYEGHQLSGQSAPWDLVFVEGKDKIPSFYVGRSEEPNINYVAYLSWLKNVFVDYPEVYEDAKIKFNKGGSVTRFNDPTLVYHMEHPAFAYYPIVGATWHQVQQYLVWKTDRLNEDILIQTGISNEDFNQFNEENFNTESYIYGQYMGSVKNSISTNTERKSGILHRRVQWEDGILFGGFRLPTEAEWELLQDESNEKTPSTYFPYGKRYPYLKWLRPYTGYSDDLLVVADYESYWKSNKPIKSDEVQYSAGIQGPYLSNKPSNVAGNVKEWLMDVYRDTVITDWDNMAEYFYKIGFETRSEKHSGVYDMDGIIDLKDSLGRLRFRILGINSDGSPMWALHPKRNGIYQISGYDTVHNYINPSEYYLESSPDSLYAKHKDALRYMYLYYKQLKTQGRSSFDAEEMQLTFLLQNVVRYNHVYQSTEIPKGLTVSDIDREVYYWTKRIWAKTMTDGKCAINLVDYTLYSCNDTGMFTNTLTPRYVEVDNDVHQQLKLVRGGTWEQPNHANREYMMADSGSSEVGFRVVLPYTNMPVKSRYKVNWK